MDGGSKSGDPDPPDGSAVGADMVACAGGVWDSGSGMVRDGDSTGVLGYRDPPCTDSKLPGGGSGVSRYGLVAKSDTERDSGGDFIFGGAGGENFRGELRKSGTDRAASMVQHNSDSGRALQQQPGDFAEGDAVRNSGEGTDRNTGSGDGCGGDTGVAMAGCESGGVQRDSSVGPFVRGKLPDSSVSAGGEVGKAGSRRAVNIWSDDLSGKPDRQPGDEAGYSITGQGGERNGGGDLQSGVGVDCDGMHCDVAVGNHSWISGAGEHSAGLQETAESDRRDVSVYWNGFPACVFSDRIVFK